MYPNRALAKAAISKSAACRAEEADPNHGRCLLESCPRSQGVNYVHCIPRKLGNVDSHANSVIDRLEWWWGMQRYTLNLDTRYNIMCLSSDFHGSFLQGRWLLVPGMDIIDRYYDNVDLDNPLFTRKAFPTIPNGIFDYKMVPVGDDLRDVAVPRREILETSSEDPQYLEYPKVSDFKIHLYPFDKIKMQAHLHPFRNL